MSSSQVPSNICAQVSRWFHGEILNRRVFGWIRVRVVLTADLTFVCIESNQFKAAHEEDSKDESSLIKDWSCPFGFGKKLFRYLHDVSKHENGTKDEVVGIQLED